MRWLGWRREGERERERGGREGRCGVGNGEEARISCLRYPFDRRKLIPGIKTLER